MLGKQLYQRNTRKVSKWSENEPPCDKTNKLACAPSEDSDQPGHPPSLIRVFAVRMKKALVLSYQLSAQWRLWSDWADAQADLSLRWAHSHFVGFVMRLLKCFALDNIPFPIRWPMDTVSSSFAQVCIWVYKGWWCYNKQITFYGLKYFI